MEISVRNRQKTTKINLLRIKKTASRTLKHLVQKNNSLKNRAGRLELSVMLVNNRIIKSLNRDYRGIDKVTDVLSFPQNDPFYFSKNSGLPIHLGDIVISIPKAKAQALENCVSFYEELSRLLVHGLLHLLGYDHEDGRHKALKMRRREKELMEILCR
ncbi:MAG: rRNA maturation RNase YbeY [Nitrospirae bacterium]|nr:rRNA maturation RNase YbeY [Nitrospirota bacterium]